MSGMVATHAGGVYDLPALWSRSYFVASVGAISAATVSRYIDTQCERPLRTTTAARG